MHLSLRNLVLPLAPFELRLDVELRARTTAIFGPSGSGKTSVLDVVAGLRQPACARIELDGELLTDTVSGRHVGPQHRRLGYVPQDLALFPHLSVRGNLLFSPHSRNTSTIRLDEILDILEIRSLMDRKVSELSGGEKQRVSLGRALLSRPRLLLLDEPLASLDAPLKARVLPYLVRIRDELGIPMLYVTHDRLETLTLAEEMLVLVQGRMLQHGPVQTVFSRPSCLEVASLLSVETVEPGRIEQRADDLVTVRVGRTLLRAADAGLPMDVMEVHVCIRAEDVILIQGVHGPGSPRNHLPATVREMSREGSLMRVDLDCGFPLAALLTRQACAELKLGPGTPVTVSIKAPDVHLIPRGATAGGAGGGIGRDRSADFNPPD